jgi:hypothetical protein
VRPVLPRVPPGARRSSGGADLAGATVNGTMTIRASSDNSYDPAVAALLGNTIPTGSGNTASPNNVEVKNDWNEFGFQAVCGTRLTDITTSGRISQTLLGQGCFFEQTETYSVTSATFVGCTLTSNGDSTFPSNVNVTASISPGDGVVTITLPPSSFFAAAGVAYNASWQLDCPHVSAHVQRSSCAASVVRPHTQWHNGLSASVVHGVGRHLLAAFGHHMISPHACCPRIGMCVRCLPRTASGAGAPPPRPHVDRCCSPLRHRHHR